MSLPGSAAVPLVARQAVLVEAFADEPCCGNGAAVVHLDQPMGDPALQAIATEAKEECGATTEVAIKGLGLAGMTNWKQLQLFEREAAALRALNHLSIPKYLDYFEDDTDDDKAFFLVQVSQQRPPMQLAP